MAQPTAVFQSFNHYISDLDGGSAVATDGDASGSDIDDAFNDNEGQVNLEQGDGDQEVEQTITDPPVEDMGGE